MRLTPPSTADPAVQQPSRCPAITYLLTPFLLGIGLLAPPPAASEETVALSGQVVTYTGQTIPSGVEITLETEMGERAAQTPAHSDGRFDIVGLRKLRYRLIVTAGGFVGGPVCPRGPILCWSIRD
jgi:hypothetical protein